MQCSAVHSYDQHIPTEKVACKHSTTNVHTVTCQRSARYMKRILNERLCKEASLVDAHP